MLETVYVGLSQLPNLTSLTVRFPSSRHPRPTTVIPPMPHLRSLKVTDIDPLCYPDDISTLLHKSRKLEELKMHWSPRMREEQEPSVVLHHYFRKCIAAKSPLKIKRLSLQNLYALHTEEFTTAFDQSVIEEITTLISPGIDETTSLNTFVDNSWPSHPPTDKLRIKSLRHDGLSKKHCEFLTTFSGLERLYFVNPIRHPGDYVNFPRQSEEPSSSTTTLSTPPIENNTTAAPPPPNGAAAVAAALAGAPAMASTPASPRSPAANGGPSPSALLRDTYLNNVFTHHGSTLRHLLLPSRWALPAATIARIVGACPNLEQLALAPEISSMETLGILLPSLRKLVAVRLLIPTGNNTSTPVGVNVSGISASARPSRSVSGHSSSSRTSGQNNNNINNNVPVPVQILSEILDFDDNIHNERIGVTLADKEIFGNLKLIGLGWRTWELGEFYTIPAASAEKQLKFPPAQGLSGDANGNVAEPDHGHATAGTPHETPAAQAAAAAASPTAAATVDLSRPPPPSILGKRPRHSVEASSSAPPQQQRPQPQSSYVCAGEPGYNASGEKVLWRRRVRRVGWDVLKHWEIWGLDVQEI